MRGNAIPIRRHAADFGVFGRRIGPIPQVALAPRAELQLINGENPIVKEVFVGYAVRVGHVFGLLGAGVVHEVASGEDEAGAGEGGGGQEDEEYGGEFHIWFVRGGILTRFFFSNGDYLIYEDAWDYTHKLVVDVKI